jgi:hypothetical protein
MYNVPETDIIMRKDQRLKIPNPRYEQVRWMLNCKNQEMQLCKTNNAIKSINIKNDQSFYLSITNITVRSIKLSAIPSIMSV